MPALRWRCGQVRQVPVQMGVAGARYMPLSVCTLSRALIGEAKAAVEYENRGILLRKAKEFRCGDER